MSDVHRGQIIRLVDDGDGVGVQLAGMLETPHVPGTALTIDGKPATVAEVMAWHAAAKGGAFCELVTEGLIILQGVSADFRSKP